MSDKNTGLATIGEWSLLRDEADYEKWHSVHNAYFRGQMPAAYPVFVHTEATYEGEETYRYLTADTVAKMAATLNGREWLAANCPPKT